MKCWVFQNIQEEPRNSLEWKDLDQSLTVWLYVVRGYITQKAINTIITPSNVVEQNKKMLNFNQINLYNVSTLCPLFYWGVIKLIMAGVYRGPAAVLSALSLGLLPTEINSAIKMGFTIND